MPATNAAPALYNDLLEGAYDCVDRIVLRAYFRFIQEPGGFRLWWRRWQGSEEDLDDTHLMRVAGHFARRLRAWAKAAGVPVIFSEAGQRKELISAACMPADPDFTGLFLVVVGRAPASVWHVEHTTDGRIRRIERKRPWVNHYAFHIRDRDWRHVIIRFCPHRPFNALIILNSLAWVAAEAFRSKIAFRKEDNCFTDLSNAAGLEQIAETLSSESSVGRLLQVCERWIYSAVLCFAVDIADQERTDIWYSYSVYQGEYSRNLLFRRGSEMDQLCQRVIDRVRGRVQLKTVCTLFGRRQRPRRRKGAPQEPTVEVVLERPEYDLIIIRVHFDRLTLKIYTKGERVLRIEAWVVVVWDPSKLRPAPPPSPGPLQPQRRAPVGFSGRELGKELGFSRVISTRIAWRRLRLRSDNCPREADQRDWEGEAQGCHRAVVPRQHAIAHQKHALNQKARRRHEHQTDDGQRVHARPHAEHLRNAKQQDGAIPGEHREQLHRRNRTTIPWWWDVRLSLW